MTSTEAKRLVVTSLFITGGLAAVRDLSKKQAPDLRIGLGVVVAGVVLAAGAEVAPDVAGSLALLMLVTAVFVVGGDGWAALKTTTGGKPT